MLRNTSSRWVRTNFVLTDLKTELEDWCRSYLSGFNAFDVDAISDHWRFPALVLQTRRSIGFKSRDHFTKNTSALLGFYEVQGVNRAVRKLLDYLRLDSDTVAMTVEDWMLDKTGKTIVTWKAAYTLQRDEHQWKAVMAVAEGEVAAWKARGTPLGS